MGILPDWMIKRDVKITPLAECESRPNVISYGLTSYGYDARIGYKFRVFSPINATVTSPKNFNPKALIEVDLTPTTKHKWKLCDDVRECIHCGSQNLYGSLEEFNRWMSEVCPKSPLSFIRIPPHSFVLAETVEYFEIPRDCLAVVVGKSTYARCGIIVNVTPLEPEWRGKVTVEISNTTPLPAEIYCGEGIMQVIFIRTDGHSEACLNAIRRLCGDEAREETRWFAHHKLLTSIEELLHKDLGHGTCEKSYADKKGKYQDQDGLTLPKVEDK